MSANPESRGAGELLFGSLRALQIAAELRQPRGLRIERKRQGVEQRMRVSRQGLACEKVG